MIQVILWCLSIFWPSGLTLSASAPSLAHAS